MCDNTWLTGCLFNPLAHGADLVVESMTKYVSAGRCIGGHVLGPNGLMASSLGPGSPSSHCFCFRFHAFERKHKGFQGFEGCLMAFCRCSFFL